MYLGRDSCLVFRAHFNFADIYLNGDQYKGFLSLERF